MIIFDASYLIVYLHPNPEPPKDRNKQPVTNFRERVNHLVATLNASDQVIGVPTPALAEILVRAGKGKFRYLQTIGDSYKFEILPFDQRAAIDAGELIALIKDKNKKQPLSTWAKVKFDIQIAAIGKTVGATVIYSDDKNIEAHGKRLNIPVKRICDLPLPQEKQEPPQAIEESTAQGELPLSLPGVEDQNAEEGKAIQAQNPAELPTNVSRSVGDATGEKAKEEGQVQEQTDQGKAQQPLN
jgi:predicted nucleic acid-binding protein